MIKVYHLKKKVVATKQPTTYAFTTLRRASEPFISYLNNKLEGKLTSVKRKTIEAYPVTLYIVNTTEPVNNMKNIVEQFGYKNVDVTIIK